MPDLYYIRMEEIKKRQEERRKRHEEEFKVPIALRAFRKDLYEIYTDKTKENDIDYLIELDGIIEKKMKKIYKISRMWIND
jgi:hypothetical protein